MRMGFAICTRVYGAILLMVVCSLALAQNARTSGSPPRQIRVGVLGLFHPHGFGLTAPTSHALVLRAGEERIVLEGSSGVNLASIRINGGEILLTAGARTVHASTITVTGRQDEAVDFVLAVPGKITRRYNGTLEIKPSEGNLVAVVSMDLESAVASVVAAESMSDTPLEALKAQAIAVRSYFVAARSRHRDFDFCDTTHCQFLREPPAVGSAVANAVAATRGFVLAYDSRPFAAMYTGSCSGHTRTPAELGLPSGAYPYYSVECKYCLSHPARWSSRVSAQDAATLRTSDESARLNIDRRLGWSTVPSNDFVVKRENDDVILEGTGEGHGIGLCQSGAKAMAEEGATFRQILIHYYPNTAVVTF